MNSSKDKDLTVSSLELKWGQQQQQQRQAVDLPASCLSSLLARQGWIATLLKCVYVDMRVCSKSRAQVIYV